ncbi:hypothetical protein MPTA5024_30605 [Microbispora sp. ATCC PTA-5024]|nr:hypothetical protein MPTA5024_30605 [Microbispora sp. ATCC PTA-5024]
MVEALGRAGVHACRRTQLGVRAREGQAAIARDQDRALDPQVGLGDRAEAAGHDTQPDRPAAPVLRPGEEQLRHAVQGIAGRDRHLVHGTEPLTPPAALTARGVTD